MCVLSLRQKQTLALSSPWLGPRNLADKTKGYNFTSRGLLTYGGRVQNMFSIRSDFFLLL